MFHTNSAVIIFTQLIITIRLSFCVTIYTYSPYANRTYETDDTLTRLLGARVRQLAILKRHTRGIIHTDFALIFWQTKRFSKTRISHSCDSVLLHWMISTLTSSTLSIWSVRSVRFAYVFGVLSNGIIKVVMNGAQVCGIGSRSGSRLERRERSKKYEWITTLHIQTRIE